MVGPSAGHRSRCGSVTEMATVEVGKAREYLERAEEWVCLGGEVLRKYLATDQVQIWEKSNKYDLVTEADKAVEDLIATKISEEYGSEGHRLLGEEGHNLGKEDSTHPWAGPVWVVDPIDGTTNFIEIKRDFAICLGLYWDGEPVLGIVYDVVAERLYTAIAGEGAWCNGEPLRPNLDRPLEETLALVDFKELQALPRLGGIVHRARAFRRYGSAAIECVEIAAGRAGVFAHMWVNPWDVAAAYVIVTEAGCRMTRLDGTTYRMSEPGSALVATPRIHSEVVELLFKNRGLR